MGRLRRGSVDVIDHLSCPVCGGNDWHVIGAKTYRQSDVGKLDDYVKLRYRVLFEGWHRTSSEIEIRSNVCNDCGFVTNVPRPSADDLDAKYRLFNELQAAGKETPAPAGEIDIRRADLLYRCLARHLPTEEKARILDFGGGDGRLMRRFIAAGHRCELVDYRLDVLPGVVKIGSTEADVPNGRTYDAIVCSHVLEHVADPRRTITMLASHLSKRGVLFVEVPMEIWKRAPLHVEPVTHVNFFQAHSMRRLLQGAGLRSVACRLEGYGPGELGDRLVVRAIGTPGRDSPAVAGEGARETERLLRPDFLMKLRVLAMTPASIPGTILHRARQVAKAVASIFGLHLRETVTADRVRENRVD